MYCSRTYSIWASKSKKLRLFCKCRCYIQVPCWGKFKSHIKIDSRGLPMLFVEYAPCPSPAVFWSLCGWCAAPRWFLLCWWVCCATGWGLPELLPPSYRGAGQPELYAWRCQPSSEISTAGIHVVTCCLPGQHPEEDDTLVSGGLAKSLGRRRGLIVPLKAIGEGCFRSLLWLRIKTPLAVWVCYMSNTLEDFSLNWYLKSWLVSTPSHLR